MSQVFDPTLFLEVTVDSPFEDRIPLPIGEYTAMIGQIAARSWQSRDGTKSGVAWDIPLVIDVPHEVQRTCNCGPTLKITDSAMLDINESGNGFDMGPGRNRVLKDYREATNTNRPGDKFGAKVLEGKVIKVKITHDLWEGKVREKITGRLPA
jgi:hypothetical protein